MCQCRYSGEVTSFSIFKYVLGAFLMAHSGFLGTVSVDMERGLQGRTLDTSNTLLLLLNYMYTFLTVSSFVYFHVYYKQE